MMVEGETLYINNFQNDILLDSVASVTHDSNFWDTSRSGVVAIWPHLGLPVEPRGNLEKK